MRRALVGMFLAAGAMLPGLASAQDHNGDWRAARQAQRAGEARPAPQPRPQQPAGQPQAAQPHWGGDRGGWQHPGGSWGGRDAAPAVQQPVQSPGQPQARFGGDRGGWQRPAGDDGQRRWGGRDGSNRWGGTPPVQATPQPAQQQPQQQAWNRDGRHDWRGDRGGVQNGVGRPDWNRGNGGRPDSNWNGGNGGRPGWNGNTPNRYDRGHPSTGWQRDRADWRDHYTTERRFDDRAGWNRGWRNDNRYDWNRYRYGNRSAFHLPRYYAPYGWGYGYRRFSIGVTLNSLLFADQYWIDDPFDYRLPEAYGPYRWVRYYNDAMLVDIETGEVMDVVYDIFW